MKKALFKIVFPAIGIALWLTICIPICRRQEGIDYFFLWILLWFIPRGFGIAGTVGVFFFFFIVGGMIGGVVLLVKIIRILINCILLVTGRFWKLSTEG